ncbi:hypothetical protein BGZ74_000082 [Mortierella antarctica]|nr:hypothetical protein BGZ74_000082 [Mortierella antarctica]
MPEAWSSSASTTSSRASTPAAMVPVTPTVAAFHATLEACATAQATTPDIMEPPQRPTTPPPRKRDLPFVMFSPSKSQRRGGMSSSDYGRPITRDDDDPVF